MIKEDYVSFEIAKLLKEKGFDEECNKYYGDYKYPCPTLQMTMKWLREVHNLYIIVFCNKFIYGTYPYYWSIETMKDDRRENREIKSTGIKDYTYQKYEEACKAAIKYCLENLIN